jgi:putative inorganic carbon (hco3(-)) transporter
MIKTVPVSLYMVALLVRPQDWVPGFVGFPTGGILISLCLAIGFTRLRADTARYRVPQNLLMVFYLITIFVSTLMGSGAENAIDYTILYLKRILVFFMIIWLVDSEEALLNASILFKLLTLFLAYQAVLQALTGESWGGLTQYPGYNEIRVRWYGDWDGPNVFAILFVIALALSFEYVFGQNGLGSRIFHAFLCSAYLVGIYFTNSRGAVLSAACSLFFFFFMRKKNVVGITIAVACFAALMFFGPSRMSEVHSGESSAHERTWLWEQGLQMLKNNPVLGVGRGQFTKNTDGLLIAHSNYVQNFSELGLVGFFLFMSGLWFSFKGAYMVGYGSPVAGSPLSSLGRSMCCALVGFSACTFFVVMELDIYYFLIGLGTATYIAGRADFKLADMAIDWKTAAIIFGMMAVIIFTVWVVAVMEIL